MIVEDLRCPGCGHPVSSSDSRCEYCGRAIEISSFTETESLSLEDLKKHISLYNTIIGQDGNAAAANFSKGICFLKLKLFKNALDCFDKTISADFTFSDAYFYAAVAVLEGKSPFVLNRSQIDKAENYLNNATSFSDKAIYYYFLAFIRYDYYCRKAFSVTPDYKDYLLKARSLNVGKNDIENLFAVLGLDINKAL